MKLHPELYHDLPVSGDVFDTTTTCEDWYWCTCIIPQHQYKELSHIQATPPKQQSNKQIRQKYTPAANQQQTRATNSVNYTIRHHHSIKDESHNIQ